MVPFVVLMVIYLIIYLSSIAFHKPSEHQKLLKHVDVIEKTGNA
jgi:hypothetical protein